MQSNLQRGLAVAVCAILAPLGMVPALQLIPLMKTNPMMALAQFGIDVASGL